jgi:hypothetical protein
VDDLADALADGTFFDQKKTGEVTEGSPGAQDQSPSASEPTAEVLAPDGNAAQSVDENPPGDGLTDPSTVPDTPTIAEDQPPLKKEDSEPSRDA